MHSASLQASEIVWQAGRNAILIDTQGNEYLDGLSCLWNVLIGHGRQELADAAAKQIQQLPFASTFAGSSHTKAIELAERLAEICYPAIRNFFFTNSGSEAVEAAIKTARFYWRMQGQPDKSQIICLTHAYHGTTLGAMSATGLPQYCDMFEPRAPGFIHVESPYPDRFELQTDAAANGARTPGAIAAERLEAAILQSGADTIAAFLAEPVQAAGGCIVPPDDYWRRVREICNRHKVLLIADEVVTGFGRTGKWFALEHWNVQPDMVAFAKGLTSGYFPMGGLGVNAAIADALDAAEGPQRWAHACTTSGHPVGCAVALANLAIIEREQLLPRAAALGDQLLAELHPLAAHPHVGDIRGLGLLAAVELVAHKAAKTPFPPPLEIGRRVYQAALRRGLFSRTRGDIYHLAPPLICSGAEIERIVDILAQSILEICGSR